MRVTKRKYTNTSKGYDICSSRKSRSKRVLKSAYKCFGGVLDEHKLFLSTTGTLPFSIGGVRGYYDSSMRWVEL